ncbi:MAG TPA: endonuclease/exonuclease/phosphatase family protein [Polyangia bacterium]|nr:endonuclease/exonuclease/phosphatase family protein [Polyangia bacterium]
MQKLRVMTYNVRYFSHATRGLASTGRTMDAIALAIARLDPLPDIVCLQELETASVRANLAHPRGAPEDTQLSRLMLHLHTALSRVGKADSYAGYYFPAHTYRLTRRRNIYTTGLAVLAHHDFHVDYHNAGRPADITYRRLQAVADLKQTRISAHVRFLHKSGQTIDIFNTHLSLPAFWAREFWAGSERMGYGRNQLAEGRKLADFIDRERQSDRYIVVGDFNALPGSPLHRYLTEERGLRDAFHLVSGGNFAELRKWPTAGFLHLRMHLDHVFTGPGIEWIDFEGSEPYGSRSSPFYGLSDHVPLIARCRIPDGEAKAAETRPEAPRGNGGP